ncbi:aminomethyl-transferring glycine dehydrogenase [Microbulbifer discodermiae]|uniref:aminomethyl-transferring glycine dehydrogenase n=1 Tax=Microbulbifer sp. 2201CG32-9 TaxID=3232309 RepID=UPI00345B6A04
MTQRSLQQLEQHDAFIHRHIGPDEHQVKEMLETLGVGSLDQLLEKTVPASIRDDDLDLADPVSEEEALAELHSLAQRNKIYRTFIGMGYHDTITPNVILRNLLENPGWYTAYTPYQPEIAQGRLEGLLNFQQMVMDLTGMELANASMLDEGTAAAEAMAMCKRQVKRNKSNVFFVDADCHPQTIAIVQTRAEHFGFEVVVGSVDTDLPAELFGALLQYPGSTGEVRDLTDIIAKVHQANGLVTVATDLMGLVALKPPGEMGADVVVGCNQRFGIPMGYGGPHAGFFAFREAFKRSAPGRIISVSVDSKGRRALRMAMQTREQHIRREKANSNICTSQVLLAVMSACYAIYHGPEGLKTIAARIQRLTDILATGLTREGFNLAQDTWFDTLNITVGDKQAEIYQRALKARINLRKVGDDALGVSLHETASLQDVSDLLDAFTGTAHGLDLQALDSEIATKGPLGVPAALVRSSDFLTHPVFNSYHSETEMLRYLKTLESRDIALNHSMIPLGSCTMKLNATAEMIPVTWPEFGKLHPFAPADQAQGYAEMFSQLQRMLAACTGYDAVSLQPNAGSQGEYAGLIAIKKYFAARGETQRDICLIPASAHGTNPASAMMVSMKVVVVACDDKGNVDMADLKAKVDEHRDRIAALMVTYPSTHGVFEEGIRDICDLIHSVGGQVYIDGANMNALIGVAAPGRFGGDVSHLNLHKTFCIPHGGGGPGMGPIAVGEHLKPYLASHPIIGIAGTDPSNGTISAAPWGSASILPISWMYIRMMGRSGMRRATEIAILNANYVARRLSEHYSLLYTGANGFVAHECLVDLRPLKDISGITEEDIAKRLMDFGFHAPTMSFPVAGTLMIEPTESESKEELDRFILAMTTIRQEVEDVVSGSYSAEDNPLHNAPHTLEDVMADQWPHSYSRDVAARPAPWLKEHKVWPASNRIDNVYGDRNLICSCPPLESYLD